ncbi:MAG: NUDIX domain-containing protein [Defluviitaleaceae bacterium]|nr:NUDIX domain-containing protein [Defluviitaleaceae bacterium]MCL2835467.1 NUDIX domain-containing protein [Defluviitaleaceae bacterium]
MTVEGVITGFLKNGDNYLLMKRADNRRFYPGMWSGIGGHMEESEMNAPERACLREIFEETGIAAGSIDGLKLRYIHVAPRDTYIVIHYIFFGDTTESNLIQTDEGETLWVPEREVPGKDYTPVMRRLVEHYFTYAKDNGTLFLFNESDMSITPLME